MLHSDVSSAESRRENRKKTDSPERTLQEVCEGWLASGHFIDANSFWQMSLYDALLVLRGIGTRTENQILLETMYQGNLLAMILNTTPRETRKSLSMERFLSGFEREEGDDE